MEVASFDRPEIVANARYKIHHLRDPLDVVVRRAEKLNQALERILPEHPRACEVAGHLSKPPVRGGESRPNLHQRHPRIEEIEKRRRSRGIAGCVVDKVGNFPVLELFKGDEVGTDSAGVLDWPSLLPSEGLAGGEGERQGELRMVKVQREPQACSINGLGGMRS